MVLVVVGEKVQGKANQDTDKIIAEKVDRAFYADKSYEGSFLSCRRLPLLAQLVKYPPAMQKTPFQFCGWEDPLEKG